MAENAQTLTRKESAARAGDGQGRQKQGRVTDAEGEQSVLAPALRRPKPGPAREAREHGVTYTRPISDGAKGFGATPKVVTLSLAAG